MDIFEEPDLRGACRRLYGPGQYLNLVETAGARSMILGPAATVVVSTQRGSVRYKPSKSHIVAHIRVGKTTSLNVAASY